MWRDAGRTDDAWRGSIDDVATGRRRYVGTAADVSEFIASALRSLEANTDDSAPD
jgi:hypothetical protein